MRLRLSLLLAIALVITRLGTSAPEVRGAPVSITTNSSAVHLYFPFISKAPASCSAAALPPVDWDPRLGPGGLPLLDQVRIIPATVAPCGKYWRVVVVKFEDINESGNDHTIYVKVLDERGNRVTGERLHVTSWGGLSEYPTEKPAGDLCNCNFDYPMFGDSYNVQIDSALPSDTMAGMIMPMKRHVNYRITFQRVLKPG